MDWLPIIGLLLFGTFLIVAEVIFVPGTTLVGILGFLFGCYGVFMAFDRFGTATGTAVLIGAVALNIIALVIAFKGQSWERFSLKNSHQAHVNDDFKVELSVGDQGKTISSLKPVGKALFQEKELEVRSEGHYIRENMDVEILRIESNKIFVKQLNNNSNG